MTTVTGRDIYVKTNAFNNNKTIENVDCNYTKWENNSLYNAFYNCTNLIQASNVNNRVTNMVRAFTFCSNLVNAPSIPDGVTDLYSTFYSCYNLVNAPSIPNSVTSTFSTFDYCYNLVNAPYIPDGVTTMNDTFYCCNNINNVPHISNSTMYMRATFYSCRNLVTVPNIPDSVTYMDETFYDCINLIDVPHISNNVTYMNSTFKFCSNLVNVGNIPGSVTNTSNAFNYCSSLVNAPEIGDGNNLVDASYMFSECYNLVNCPRYFNSANLQSIDGIFSNCLNICGNVTFKSEKISSARKFVSGNLGEMNVYIPFIATEQYQNTSLYAWNCTDEYDETNKCTVYVKANIPEVDDGSGETWYPLYYANGEPFNDNEAWYDQYENCIYFSDNYDDHNFIGYSDYANNIGASVNIGDNSLTYQTFTNLGYDEYGSKDGIYLKDINDTGLCKLKVLPTPREATVTLTADGYTQTGNTISVPVNTQVNITVSMSGYNTVQTQEIVNKTGIVYIQLDDLIDLYNYKYKLNNGDLLLTKYTGSGNVEVPTL